MRSVRASQKALPRRLTTNVRHARDIEGGSAPQADPLKRVSDFLELGLYLGAGLAALGVVSPGSHRGACDGTSRSRKAGGAYGARIPGQQASACDRSRLWDLIQSGNVRREHGEAQGQAEGIALHCGEDRLIRDHAIPARVASKVCPAARRRSASPSPRPVAGVTTPARSGSLSASSPSARTLSPSITDVAP